jgi:putative ABC transport system permease protein
MFSLDRWQEIYNTLQKNQMRTFLTGFSVAWGIFMLIILLGSGNGLENGVKDQFRGGAINGIWLSSGTTSMEFKGLKTGRQIKFNEQDYNLVKNTLKGYDHISARLFMGVILVSHSKEYGSFFVSPSHPDYGFIKEVQIIDGRFLNQIDIREFRKVAVIGEKVKSELFKGKDSIAMGQYINIRGVPFRVVGIFRDYGRDDNEQRRIYIPISTAQRTFYGDNTVNQIAFTTGSASPPEAEAMANHAKMLLARQHTFDPADKMAIDVMNKSQDVKRVMSLFTGIRIFDWIIGIGTIIAGVVGVSNIMMISVKERTKEIGIRKALGATPGSVIGMIIQESLIITGLAGYIGLVLGVGVLELISTQMPPSDFFKNPQADIGIALGATVLLIVAGALAGLFPALKAAGIRPIEALRDE